MHKLSKFLFSALIFILFAYPIFYFVYKFGNLEINGLRDYLEYYKLYKDFAYQEIDQAYNPRFISSFLVFLLGKLGIYYDVPIAQNIPGFEQSVYFNAIIVSFFGALGTALVLQQMMLKWFNNYLLSHLPGILYFLSYGLITWGAYALVDGFAIFIFTLAALFYFQKSKWIYLVLVVAIFQRDLILVCVAGLSFFDFLYFRLKTKSTEFYPLIVFVTAVGAFLATIVLRETVFSTHTIYPVQGSSSYLNIFDQSRYAHGIYFRSAVFSQNLLVIYVAILLWLKHAEKISVSYFNLGRVLFIFLLINFMAFVIKVPNEVGRYFSVCSSLIPLFMIHDILSFKFNLNLGKIYQK